jgi:hypothetical protein
MLGLIFRTNYTALIDKSETILGENAAMVKHIAVYNLPVYGPWFMQPTLANFLGSLESFAILDLRQWEDGTTYGHTRLHPRGFTDIGALREALGPEVLRAENLVRIPYEELAQQEEGASGFRRLINQVTSIWARMSDRELDVKVMKLPFSGPWKENFEEMKANGMVERIVDFNEAPNMEGDNMRSKTYSRRRSCKWGYLGRLFSKDFW